MEKASEHVIKNQIVPIVQNGFAVLFLGAGFSAGTPSRNGLTIPSSGELVKRILDATENLDVNPENVDLQTAFSVGEDELEDFDSFLFENFTCRAIFDWQLIPFRYWWRRVFTTNIDNVIDTCTSTIQDPEIQGPRFLTFNYKDSIPVIQTPLQPPIVYLHGTINKPKDGFIFDRISYADHSIKSGDWLHDAAFHISSGDCVIIGSRLNESDLEAEIRKRSLWCENSSDPLCPKPNYIVLDKFNSIEKKAYLKRNIIPIEAKAHEFFEYISNYIRPISQSKLIKRIAPHLRHTITNDNAFFWFNDSFNHVPSVCRKASQSQGIYSQFFSGDMPDWFYIVNGIPSKFDYFNSLMDKINNFFSAYDKNSVLAISITGPVASGKSTLAKLVAFEISQSIDAVYEYDSFDGVDIEATWSSIQNIKGNLVLLFDNCSEHFYAINAIGKRFIEEKDNAKLLIIIEERQITYERNKHHLINLSPTNLYNINIPALSYKNAILLFESLENEQFLGEKLKNVNKQTAAKLICDTERGYRGDLFATMVDISGKKTFVNQLTEEFSEIATSEAKTIYIYLTLVTGARLSLPISYISEILNINVSTIMAILSGELRGKIHVHEKTLNISSRHHIIAEYHLKELIADDDKEQTILKLMKCVSQKYTIEDIRKHPLPYRIYKSILHHRFLHDTLFPNSLYRIENVYSQCQEYFKDDGIFWLQYGRSLYYEGRLKDAEHCFRKGLGIYDSFQIRHSLGQVLLKLYVAGNCIDVELLEEGTALLLNEIDERGTNDPYPFTTLGHCLIDILKRRPGNNEISELLKTISNRGTVVSR